jgi:RND family efflux transporter MFP subunit
MRSICCLIAAFGVAVALLGCSRETPLNPTEPLDVVVAQPQPPGAKPDLITDWDVYTGNVEAKDSVEIRARVRGHIKKILFTEGKEISAGEELFLIDSEPFQADLKQAKGQLATWEAELKLADEKIAFYKPLAEKNTISKEELLKVFADKSKAQGEIDKAKGKILEAELNISYCQINSPIAGKVGEALLSTGDLVNASGAESLLTTVVAVDPMYVNFYVNERAYQRYRKQLAERIEKNPALAKEGDAKIPVELSVEGEPDFPFKGYVDFVDNRVIASTGSVKVRARFENPKGPSGLRALTSGLFARVRVTITDPYPAILVADRAILSDQSLKYVLIVDKADGNKVKRVDVVASSRLQEDGRRAIEAGLKGDEWVIVEGVNRARPGVTVAPTEGKMPRRPNVGQ